MKQKTLSNAEVSGLCLELSLLLRAGVAAGDGLHLLAEEETDPARSAMLTAMADQADGGEPLSAALRQTGSLPAYVTGLVEVGERSGRTEEALGALARYYEERERLDRYVRSALLYPAILMLLMVVVVVVLLSRVLPVFDDVYASLGSGLTGVAGSLLALGRWLDRAMPALLALLAIAAVFLTAFASSGTFRASLLGWWNRRHGDRGLARQLAATRSAQALAMGLMSGLPVEESLSLAASLQEDVPAAAARCQEASARLERGENLAAALRGAGVFSAADCRLLALGLRSGTGDTVMAELSRRMGEDSRQAMEDKLGRVEPAMVIATSLLVGLILLSVMLPLMHIMAAIG